jgi:ferredoxin
MMSAVSNGYQGMVEGLKRFTIQLEKGINAAISQKYNPLYYHGAMPNFFLWVLFLSGLLLFAYYNPTLENAYPSVFYITNQIPSGALMRAMHRYAADGMMIFVLIHVARVWFTDRYREFRILPWLTGVILLSVLFFAGLTGYMLIWDAESVALVTMTVNFIKAFPLIGSTLAMVLINGSIITDYTLVRFLFLHLAIPASMLFFLWWHYLRITRPVTNAPFVLNVVMMGALLVACGLLPISIGNAPQLASPQNEILLDWLYMLPQGLIVNGSSVLLAWIVLLSVPVLMVLLPYLQNKQYQGQFATVVSESCTGCSLCYHDCPYEAIEMVDRDDDTRFKRIAIVDPGRCANCGLCVGACAFKAIEIPRMQTDRVFKDIETVLAGG